MVELKRVEHVRNTTELAKIIMPKLDFPDRLGSEEARMNVLIKALDILRGAKIISIYPKNARARITRLGLHADSLFPKKTRAGRRHPELLRAS